MSLERMSTNLLSIGSYCSTVYNSAAILYFHYYYENVLEARSSKHCPSIHKYPIQNNILVALIAKETALSRRCAQHVLIYLECDQDCVRSQQRR